MIIMLFLFTNFYVHEYIKKTNDTKRRMQKKDINNNEVVVHANGHTKAKHEANGKSKLN